MTTTQTQKKDPSSRMSYFTGMESIGLKMVSILVILILNSTTLSSQTNSMICGTRLGIKSGIIPEKPKTYTLYAVQRFPKIEIANNNALHKMDDLDLFDYDAIFCNNSTTEKTTGPGSSPKQASNSDRKILKNKFSPTLN